MSTADRHGGSGIQAAMRVVPPALAVLGILAAVALAWELRGLLILAFVALLIAAAIHGPSEALERRGLPRILAVIAVYAAIGLVVGTLVLVIVPPLLDQAAALVEDLPSIADALLGAVVGLADRLLGGTSGREVVDRLTSELTSLRPDVGALAMLPLTLLESLLTVGMTLFLSLLLLLERDRAAQWVLRFADERHRDTFAGIGREVLGKLGAYVRGQFIVMTVIGVGTTLGMLLLGVPFALPLGLLAFLAELIPIVGPFIAAAPILGIAFLEGPSTGLLMLGWLLVIQQAESWILTPFVQGEVLSLSPVVVLLAVFAGGSLAGIVGAVISVPLIASADVVLRDVVLPIREGRRVRAQADGPHETESGSDRSPAPRAEEGAPS